MDVPTTDRSVVFVQVITAAVADEDGVRRALAEWRRELLPGAPGYLGTTAGVTVDGTMVLITLFDSPDAAERNSDRPEQALWWDELAQYLSADPYVIDSTDVRSWKDSELDRAALVQVTIGHSPDPDALFELTDGSTGVLRELPEIIGTSFTAFGLGGYVRTVYLSAADAASACAEAVDGARGLHLLDDALVLDLYDPILVSAPG
jgi:hypothetical protein